MNFSRLIDFYCSNFIPNGYSLDYTSLHNEDKKRMLYLEGSCKDCGGYMRSGSSIAVKYTGANLVKLIWREFNHYRPFGKMSECQAWYEQQECLSSEEKSRIFLSLFKKQDEIMFRT